MNKNDLLNKYYKESQIQMECTYSGNYEVGNKSSSKLEEYNKIIEMDFENYIDIVDELLDSTNPNTCIWIANVALEKNHRVDYVIEKLKMLSCDNSIGIIGFNAKMLLKAKGLY